MTKKTHNLAEQETAKERNVFATLIRGLLIVATIGMPLFFFPVVREAFQLPKQLFLLAAVLLGVCLWLLESLKRKHLRTTRTFLDAFLLLYAVTAIAATLLSVSPRMSFLGDTVNFVLHTGVIIVCIGWYWLFVSYIEGEKLLHRLLTALLIGGSIAGILFLLPFIPNLKGEALGDVFGLGVQNTVSGVSSLFGLFMAIIGILGFGLAMLKATRLTERILCMVAGAIAIIVLLQLGFTLPWLMFCIGALLLIVLGYLIPKEVNVGVVSAIFFLFLVSIFIFVDGVPSFLKQSIPLEVALGARTSWDISSQTFLGSAKNFLVGTGPGTFVYNFSLYRPESFNINEVARTLRFYQPFSAVLAMIAEVGVVGTAAFIFLILLAIGGIVGVWVRVYRRTRRGDESGGTSIVRLDIFIIAIAWIASTVGLGFSFYDMSGWWLWWWLLAATVVGLSLVKSDFVEKKSISLKVASQHLLAVSFAMVLLFTVALGIGAFGTRFLLAEIAYTRATETRDVEAVSGFVDTAIRYRPGFVPYHIARARVSLERALVESKKPVPNADNIASYLSTGINEATLATEKDPHAVDGWDMLALMYVNAGSFTKDAQVWAERALQKAVSLEPSNANLVYRYAALEESMGKTAEAEKAYRSAITKQPDLVAAYAGITNLYEQQQKNDDAIAMYEQMSGAIERQPELLYQWGRLLYNRKKEGDVEMAGQLWLRAVDIQPDHSNALYSLGLLYEKIGDKAQAKAYYQKVSALNPGNEDVEKKLRDL